MQVQLEAYGTLFKCGKAIKYDGHLSVLKLSRNKCLVTIHVYNSGTNDLRNSTLVDVRNFNCFLSIFLNVHCSPLLSDLTYCWSIDNLGRLATPGRSCVILTLMCVSPFWILSVWGQEIYIFSIFIFHALFCMLLKGMSERILLSKDEPLTPDIDGVMAL